MFGWLRSRKKPEQPKLVAPVVRFARIAADVDARATELKARGDALLAQIEATQKAASAHN